MDDMRHVDRAGAHFPWVSPLPHVAAAAVALSLATRELTAKRGLGRPGCRLLGCLGVSDEVVLAAAPEIIYPRRKGCAVSTSIGCRSVTRLAVRMLSLVTHRPGMP